MEVLDVVKDVGSGLGPGSVLATVAALAFEHAEEALSRRIVGTATDGAHAADDVVTAQKPLILITGEPATAIRMQDDRASITSLPKGHQHRLQHELALLPRAHRPADH